MGRPCAHACANPELLPSVSVSPRDLLAGLTLNAFIPSSLHKHIRRGRARASARERASEQEMRVNASINTEREEEREK